MAIAAANPSCQERHSLGIYADVAFVRFSTAYVLYTHCNRSVANPPSAEYRLWSALGTDMLICTGNIGLESKQIQQSTARVIERSFL